MSSPQHSPQAQPQAGDPFKGASREWVREIIRQGELRLQAQLQAALAADARAGVLASIQAAASAALVLFGGADDVTGSTEAAAYWAAAVAFLGAACAGIAARPISFDFAGLEPHDWAHAVQTREPEDSAERAYAEYLDDYLKDNAKRMAGNGRLSLASLGAMIATPVVAVIVLVLG